MSKETTVYVNVYDRGEAFGGHEEGGWTYSTYTLKQSLKSWCDCDNDRVVRRWFDDEQEITIYELSKQIEDQWDEEGDEEGSKATYLESFTTAGGTYDMNSADDAPSEFTHEAITGGDIHVRIEDKKGEDWNTYRPYS